MKLKQRILSVMLVLAMLVTYMPFTDAIVHEVHAEANASDPVELDISAGNIIIKAGEYTVGSSTTTSSSKSYLIKNKVTGAVTQNTITIDGYTGSVILNGLVIKSSSKAPVLIENGSKVTLDIQNTCSLTNSGTDGNNKPEAWPAICIGGGSNTVNITGDGALNVNGGKYCPAIGGACSDSINVSSNARYSEFNSKVTLGVAQVVAKGGSNAPNIGTGRGCNVTGGEFIFAEGDIYANTTNGSSVGIGLCEIDTLKTDPLPKSSQSFKSNLTLSFTGATVYAAGASNCAAIGAGAGQSAYKINISGGAIEATAGNYAHAIGNGKGGTGTPIININGGTVEATFQSNTAAVTGTSPINGKVTVSSSAALGVALNYKVDGTDSVRIPYSEYTKADYISSGFSNADGTYYKKFVKSSASEAYGKTCKYIKIGPCPKHEDVSKPSTTKPDEEHSGRCIYCDHASEGAPHNWEYSVKDNKLTETCKNCGMTHSLTVSKVTTYIFDNSKKYVTTSGKTTTKPRYTYKSVDSGVTSDVAPTTVGNYKVTATLGDKEVTVDLVINKDDMDIIVVSPECEYDGKEHTISLRVEKPASHVIQYSEDGINYSSTIPKFTLVGKHPIFYRITDSNNNYTKVDNVAYVTINPKPIRGIDITKVSAPMGGNDLDTNAECKTTGVVSTTPAIYWEDPDSVEAVGKAEFNTTYKCYMTILPDRDRYAFTTTTPCAVTINGNRITNPDDIHYSYDGTLTVYYTFPKTDTAKITYVKPISAITLENGADESVEGLHLPKKVSVTCDDTSVTELPVVWKLPIQAYDPECPIEQNFTVNGTITPIPKHTEFASGVSSGALVNVTVLPSRTGTITANLTETEYSENKILTLTTGVDSDAIYYTINGNDPFEGSTNPSESAEEYTSEGISLTCEEGSSKTYRIKARALGAGRRPSELFVQTYTINVSDKTAPTATITIGEKSWTKFLENITFGLFTKTGYSVKIDAEDNCELKKTEYLLAHSKMSLDDVKSATNWTAYTEEFTISDPHKYIVYVKVTDAAGNTAYYSSDGLVVYADSVADTTEVNVTPKITQSVDFNVKLNGNTIREIRLPDGSVVDSNHYKTDSTTGKVTLSHEVFDDLDYGDNKLTISYKPQGVDYVSSGSENDPNETVLHLNVVKPKLLRIITPGAISGVTNGTSLSAIKLPATVNVVTDPVTVTMASVTWDTSDVYSGSYDPSAIVSQKFVLHGVVQLDADSIDLNGVSKDVYIEVCVNPASQLAKPMPSIKGGSYANSVSVDLRSSDNAEIYYTLDNSTPTTSSTRYTGTITLTETTTINAICHLEGRYDSDVMSVKYTIIDVDTSAPTGSIAIGKESFWDALWSGTLYQFFTKDSQVVTISGKDADSGIKAIFYYISPVELDKDSLAEVTGWELYTEPLHLDPNVGGIIYAKIVNGDDVESFVNSNGIVVFTDPEKVTESVTYVKGTGNDVEFTVKLNGNSIKAMRNGKTALSPAHYSQTFSGNVVLSAAYLETLSTGNYTFYVDYYPLGINNSNATGNSVAPASTSLSVLVSAKSTDANNGNGSNTGGGSSSGTPNVPVIVPQDPNFEVNDTGTTTQTDSSGVVHNIETVTYTDKSKTITDTSTSKDKTKTVVVTEKDAKGATTTVATKVTTKDGTETYTVTEYVSANETKTTTNKSDTKGNTYERVYVTNKNGASSESIVSTVNDVKTTDIYVVDESGNLSQTYSTTQELNGKIIDVTVKGSGTQTSPKYNESYTLVEDGIDTCSVNVVRTNTEATATASVVKTNDAGNKVVISSDLLNDMLTTASWNAVNGSLPNVSTVHTFSSERKAVSDVDVTYKVLNDAGAKRYTLMFNTGDIVAGNKLRLFRYTDGKYVMLGANYKTVSDSGDFSITPDKNYTYLLAGPKDYKSINNSIKKSAVFADPSTAQVSKGKSTYFKLDDEFDTRNVKSITYKSKNGLVASVNNSGKVTAKRSGTAKITATIKFVNGGSKTITRSIKVK